MIDSSPFTLVADRGAPLTVAFNVKVEGAPMDLRTMSGKLIVDNKPDMTLTMQVDGADHTRGFFVFSKDWTAQLGSKVRPARIEVRYADGAVAMNKYGTIQAGGFDA